MTKITRTALMSLGIVATLAAAGFASAPAQADTYHGRPHYQQQQYRGAPALNDRMIHRRLARQGYRPIAPLHWSRGYIYTRAVDGWGRPARLTISPRTGQIVDARYHF